MKKNFLILSLILGSVVSSFAQLRGDEVLVYVKAGDNPATSESVIVIGYYSRNKQIRNMASSAREIRETLLEKPEYFKSPYNIPKTTNILSCGYLCSQYCAYNPTASTSKYIVFSAHREGGYNSWGQYSSPQTIYFAISNDKKQLLLWYAGEENERETYLLTDPSKFDPAEISSKSYDFLE